MKTYRDLFFWSYCILWIINNCIVLFLTDAYWKIAGEQMGLGKSWGPDWEDAELKKYCIYYGDGNIQEGTWTIHNSILAFPTEEIRDAFYDNFKELIESCKELL